jgi:dTDP-4-amino-4,6-dideoxygalactose transaminase
MAAILLDVQPGDEVIVPSFTFVSTANAFVMRGARPVFCDVRPDTLNLDEKLLSEHISSRTKVIVPVHYAGVGCDMAAICSIAVSHGIAVVEDNAHGLFGKYRARWLGSFGALAALSFHDTKNSTCGEGGALLVNERRFANRAEIIREKGTDRASFSRREVAKYSWVDIGSSYVMSDVLAAFLFAQLEKWLETQAKRRALWQRYNDGLNEWSIQGGARLPFVPSECDQAWHMFYIVLPSIRARDALIEHLRRRGILATFHYIPLHLSDYAKRWGGRSGDCPVAEKASDCLVRLPFFTSMTEGEQNEVIKAIEAFDIPG